MWPVHHLPVQTNLQSSHWKLLSQNNERRYVFFRTSLIIIAQFLNFLQLVHLQNVASDAQSKGSSNSSKMKLIKKTQDQLLFENQRLRKVRMNSLFIHIHDSYTETLAGIVGIWCWFLWRNRELEISAPRSPRKTTILWGETLSMTLLIWRPWWPFCRIVHI